MRHDRREQPLVTGRTEHANRSHHAKTAPERNSACDRVIREKQIGTILLSEEYRLPLATIKSDTILLSSLRYRTGLLNLYRLAGDC